MMPFIIWTSSPLFKGAVNFNYLPWKKGLEVYIVQWQVFLDGTGTLLNFFKQGLSFLNLEIILCKIMLWYAALIVS